MKFSFVACSSDMVLGIQMTFYKFRNTRSFINVQLGWPDMMVFSVHPFLNIKL